MPLGLTRSGDFVADRQVSAVKVPKVLRKSKSVDTLLNNPLGRELLAGALVAGAGAAATALAKHRPSTGQIAEAGEAVVGTGAAAASATQDAVQGAAAAIGGALRDLAGRLSSANQDRRPKKRAGSWTGRNGTGPGASCAPERALATKGLSGAPARLASTARSLCIGIGIGIGGSGAYLGPGWFRDACEAQEDAPEAGFAHERRRDFRRKPRPLALVHLRPLLALGFGFEREHADPAGRGGCPAEPLHVLELADCELANLAAQAGLLVGLPRRAAVRLATLRRPSPRRSPLRIAARHEHDVYATGLIPPERQCRDLLQIAFPLHPAPAQINSRIVYPPIARVL